jgi:hypothetical protein
MRYKPTIIGIVFWLFLAGCIIYTIANYKILSAGEGWGVVGMFGLAGIGLVGLVVDFIIQLFRKKS